MPIKMLSNKRPSFSALACKAFGALLAFLLLTLSSAHAAGLGKLTVLSSLGQPLRAEIELTSVAKDEAGTIIVRLASSEAYKRANLDASPVLRSFAFKVESRGGRHFVRVTSSQPLNEPFIGMLLELTSTTGRLTREYTFLLDPPELRTTTPALAAASKPVPTAVPRPVQAAPAPAPKPVAEQPATESMGEKVRRIERRAKTLKASQPVKAKPSDKAVADDKPSTYKVKKGDSLALIAKKHRHDEVTLEQMLVSIYQTNPDAFDGKNMNRLRVGRVLTVPDAQTAGGVGKPEARKLIVAQAADFAAYRAKLAGQVEQAAAQRQADESVQAAGGKITAKVEDRARQEKEAQDKLKLSKAGAVAKGAKGGAGTGSTEDKTAQGKAAADEKARVSELEKNVTELQKVLELKNKQLAAQQEAAAKKAADDAAAAKKAADDAAVKKAADEAAAKKAADEATARKAASASVASAPAASVPQASAPQASAPKPAVATKPASAPVKRVGPPPAPPAPPGFFDNLMDNPTMLGGGAIALLLLLYLMVRIRGRKKQPPSPTPLGGSMVSDGSESPNSLFGSAGGQSVDTNNSIFNSGFIPSASLLDANEVDPIAEADVYIAYGREAQAVEILKEALRSHPERNALRVKLLEIYASQKDVNAFDLLAGELYGLTRGEGEDWVHVAGLGASIDPTNPLYAGGDASEELLNRPTSLQGSVTQPRPELDPDVLLHAPRLSGDGETTQAAAQPTEQQIQSPDFSLDLTGPAIDDAPLEFHLPEKEAVVAPSAPLAVDFDLGQEAAKAETRPQEPAALDFDLGDFAPKKEEAAAPDATGMSVSEIPEAELERMLEFKPAAANLASPVSDIEFEARMAAADRELSAIDKVEPYSVAANEPAKPVASSSGFDFGAINLDLEPVAAPVPVEPETKPATARTGSVEMDTKIELAAAYLGIGDKEGARELLEEVIQEGSPEQVEKAKEALAKIS